MENFRQGSGEDFMSDPSHSGVIYDERLDIAYLLIGFLLLPLMPGLTSWVGQWILFPGTALLTIVQWVVAWLPNDSGVPLSWRLLTGLAAWWVAACLSAFVWSAVLVFQVSLYTGRLPCLFEPREGSCG